MAYPEYTTEEKQKLGDDCVVMANRVNYLKTLVSPTPDEIDELDKTKEVLVYWLGTDWLVDYVTPSNYLIIQQAIS